MTRIVNIHKESYDVLICRPTKWGNPYTHHTDKHTLADHVVESREKAISMYREYILSNKELMDSLDELEGKVLGCVCKPESCHGDVLLELLSKKKIEKFLKK